MALDDAGALPGIGTAGGWAVAAGLIPGGPFTTAPVPFSIVTGAVAGGTEGAGAGAAGAAVGCGLTTVPKGALMLSSRILCGSV